MFTALKGSQFYFLLKEKRILNLMSPSDIPGVCVITLKVLNASKGSKSNKNVSLEDIFTDMHILESGKNTKINNL